jgi:asparagine synthase (glutamine-hydrolysing)
MCGICGIVDFSGRGIDTETLLSIREALTHRGPDAAGLWVGEYAGLGHRRLSIIDLSEAGRQPLGNEDDTVWAICNGEIYNFRELQEQLLRHGHRFLSGSDTEVLVHAYEQWGMEGTLAKLKGMFALALWDEKAQALWLVRDRLGVKPLFYAEVHGKLLFASEAQALYGHVPVTPESIDRGALDYFLAFGYIPPDHCLVRGVHKLPPGHVLKYDRSGARCWRHWNVEFSLPPGNGRVHGGQFTEQLAEVDSLLTAAVVRRLESDVPLGSFLSGGIDSGLVTALAARALGSPLRTFTVGFEGASPDQDERPLARLVSRRYGTQHEELLVQPADQSMLPAIMWHSGEPFADISILPSYQISRLARNEITVALTGDGGDESFCGYYNVYTAYLSREVKQWVPPAVLRVLERLSSYSNGALGHQFPLARRLHTLLSYSNKSPQELYDLPNWWHSGIRSHLYDAQWCDGQEVYQASDVVAQHLREVRDLDEVEQILYTDLHLRLPGDYLTKMDIASNIVALEVRSPFLDHELVEYAAALPLSSRLFHLRQKGMLRELARKYLPPPLIHRRKTGFGPPLGDWLRGKWSSLVKELVVEGLAHRPDLFNTTVVQHIAEEHLRGKRDHAQRLWALLCLEVWWRMFIDRTVRPGDELWSVG